MMIIEYPYHTDEHVVSIPFVEIDHEIFSMVILFLLLMQEGSYQFLTKECAQVLVNRLERTKPV